jgi:hypothetical protein
MNIMLKFISTLSLFFIISLVTTAQDNETILKKENKQSSLEVFTIDSVDSELPSSTIKTTPEQDSAYYQALRMNLPVGLRLRYDLLNVRYSLISLDPDAEKTGMDYLPDGAFNPDPNMIVQRQEMLMNAFKVPYARTYDPWQGMRIPFSDIGRFFGITEDYSGNIKFRVDNYTEVEIVIYSIKAVVVATIFKGYLPAGSYERTWTGRDENGRKLPPGDYVGEVRIKGQSSYRKRIILN